MTWSMRNLRYWSHIDVILAAKSGGIFVNLPIVVYLYGLQKI